MGGSVFEGVPALQHFSITPSLNAYYGARQERRTQETHNQGLSADAIETLGRLAVSADTPERWATYVDNIQQRFPSVDLSNYRDYGMRDQALAEFDPHFRDREEAQRLFGNLLGGSGSPAPPATPPRINFPNAPLPMYPATPPAAAPPEGPMTLGPGMPPTPPPAAPVSPPTSPPGGPRGPFVNAGGEPYRGSGATTIPVDLKLGADTMAGMTPQAVGMLEAAQNVAASLGLAKIEVVGANDVGERGHRSHMYGTEFDVIGYNADGSRWTDQQRVAFASAAREAGGNRFGFYPGGSLHMGTGAPGLPTNVAWGPGGQLSGVPISAFAPEEQPFVSSLRGGVPFEQVAQAGTQMGISPQLADLYSVLGSPGFDQLATAQQQFVLDQIEKLTTAAEPVKGVVVDNQLRNPYTGAIIGDYGGAAAAPYFAGTSVEAQALNHLIESMRITKAQADDLAAGKTITDPQTGAHFFFSAGQLLGVEGASGSGPGGTQLTGGRPPTQDQSGAAGFAVRMSSQLPILEQFTEAGTSVGQYLAGHLPVPLLGNFITSPEYQQFDTAARNFVNAQLRRESGATITDPEFINAYKTYIPEPGDDPARIAQKAAARQEALENMARAAGTAYQATAAASAPAPTTAPAPTSPPAPVAPANTTTIPRTTPAPAAPASPPPPRTMAPPPYVAPPRPAAAPPAPPTAAPPAPTAAPTAGARLDPATGGLMTGDGRLMMKGPDGRIDFVMPAAVERRIADGWQPARPDVLPPELRPASPTPTADAPQPFTSIDLPRQNALRGMARQLSGMGRTPEQIIEALAARGYIVTRADLGL